MPQNRNLPDQLESSESDSHTNCPCGNDNQTTEHILFECALLNEDRERLIAAVAKKDNWPINKDMLIKKHYKAFAKLTKQIDKIKEMNS
jgi:hypothetical protein